MEPMREDGRRCLRADEMEAAFWTRDGRGRWRQPVDEKALLRIRQSRRQPASIEVDGGRARRCRWWALGASGNAAFPGTEEPRPYEDARDLDRSNEPSA
jgi:hypothetical protein